MFSTSTLFLALWGTGIGLPPDRFDRYGDPLPSGAVRRLGTVRLRGGHAPVFSSDGKLLASCGWGGLYIWDTATGKRIRVIRDVQRGSWHAAFSPSGRLLAAGSVDGGAAVFDVPTGRVVCRIPPAPYFITALAFSPDDKLLAVGNSPTAGVGFHVGYAEKHKSIGSIRVVELPSGRLLKRLPIPGRTLAFSRDGKRLASGDEADATTFRLWDSASGSELRTASGPARCRVHGFLPGDAEVLIGHDKGLSLWDVATTSLKPLRKLDGLGRRSRHAAETLAVTPDGKACLTLQQENILTLWDVATGTVRRRVERLREGIHDGTGSVALSPCGRWLAAAEDSGLIRLWEADTGRERHVVAGPRWPLQAITFTRDGKHLVGSGAWEPPVVWDVASGEERNYLEGKCEPAQEIAFSADGGRMLTSTTLEGNAARLVLRDLTNGKRLWEHVTAKEDRPFALAVSSGDFFAVVPNGRDWAQIWDARTGQKVGLPGPDQPSRVVTFSPDGRLLASQDQSDVLRVWDATGKDIVQAMSAPLPYSYIAFVCFASNGRMLAVGGGRDTAIELFDVYSGRTLRLFGGPLKRRSDVAFSPDGRCLAGSDDDGVLHVWQIDTGAEVYRFAADDVIGPVAFSPDGKYLAGGTGPAVLLWDVSGRFAKYRTPALRLAPAELERRWRDMAGLDGVQASWDLVADPARAVPLLAGRLRPVPHPEPARVERWIHDLHSDKYTVRAAAQVALAELEEAAEPWLRRALAARPGLEPRRRIEQLLANARGPRYGPERLRRARAIDALKWIATPEVERLLARLANGAPSARITQEAQAALARVRQSREMQKGTP
jgi:WD40 repeat protein